MGTGLGEEDEELGFGAGRCLPLPFLGRFLQQPGLLLPAQVPPVPPLLGTLVLAPGIPRGTGAGIAGLLQPPPCH